MYISTNFYNGGTFRIKEYFYYIYLYTLYLFMVMDNF